MKMMTPIDAMKDNTGNVFIRISDDKNQIYDYRYILRQAGFEFNKRSGDKSFYEKKTDEKDGREWELYCKKEKLRCDVIPEQFTRSADYRKDFFKVAKPAVEAKYRCAYCGRKFTYKNITVDHIIPVNQMQYSKKARKLAKRFGIENVNDTKNLVAACRSCNSKKGIKMGSWVYKGIIGKSETLWKIRMGARWTFATVAALFIVTEFMKLTTFGHMMVSALLK